MKNVRESQMKRCLYFSGDEYDTLIWSLSDGFCHAIYSDDGISYTNHDCLNVYEALSEYFGVKVLSVHTDQKVINIGVWICYEEA